MNALRKGLHGILALVLTGSILLFSDVHNRTGKQKEGEVSPFNAGFKSLNGTTSVEETKSLNPDITPEPASTFQEKNGESPCFYCAGKTGQPGSSGDGKNYSLLL